MSILVINLVFLPIFLFLSYFSTVKRSKVLSLRPKKIQLRLYIQPWFNPRLTELYLRLVGWCVQVYNITSNLVKLAEYTAILQEWNILRDQKDNEQVRITGSLTFGPPRSVFYLLSNPIILESCSTFTKKYKKIEAGFQIRIGSMWIRI